MKLLLDRGRDPNVRYQEPDSIGDFQTPLLNAAWHGDAECVKLLLSTGPTSTFTEAVWPFAFALRRHHRK